MTSPTASGYPASTVSPLVLAVDVGGTKIAWAVVDADHRVVEQGRTPTPPDGGEWVLREVARLVAEARTRHELVAVGVCCPGAVDPQAGRVVSNTGPLPNWQRVDVRGQLGRLTGLPIAVENDVRATAFAEAQLGVARDEGSVLCIAVGTGIGGAIVESGELVRRSHFTTGEVAHLLIPAQADQPCGCGRLDHIEALASGPGMEATYRARTGLDEPLTTIAGRAERGDVVALEVIQRAGILLGRALAGLASAIDIDALVIGGGVAQIGEPFLAPLERAFRSEVLPPLADLPVRRAALGTDAPLIGGALAARRLLEP